MAGGRGEAQAAEPPRALCLTVEDRGVIVGRLARAVLRFQDEFLNRESSPAGLLCQVWLPDVVEDNQIVLKTKGMPFCVAGMGDLLALFRCISCRFAFGTNVARPTTLGAPGRVFTSSEPEMCCNVQQYAKQQYLRRAEAEQCQVQSTLLLPLFISPKRSGCVGVLEVVQTSQDMRFADVAGLLAVALENCELFTCSMETVKRRIPACTHTSTMLLPPMVGVLEDPAGEPAGASDADNSLGQEGSADDAMGEERGGGRGGRGSGGAGATSDDFSGADEDDEDDDEDEDEESGATRRRSRDYTGTKGGGVQAKQRRKGLGNPGKPGVRLTLEDLQSQFGVGLKEAASRLGICPTTLKRACRRHGIQRWPRRQLQKVNRALDELEARQMMQPQQHLLPVPAGGSMGGLAVPGYGVGDGMPAADSRWTTLAQFIPAYHSGSGMLGPFQEAQFQQGILPYTVTVQQTGPATHQQQHQAAALAVAAHQQQLYLQQQQALAAMGQPTPSGLSLPDGALVMRGSGGGGCMQEVSAVSGVSTLGQPPPQAGGGGQQQQQQQAPADTTATGLPRRQGSGSSSGGAPMAAEYLQRVAAASNYVSPFTSGRQRPALKSQQPVVALPGGLGAGTVRGLSSISVPSVNVDIMPPLGGPSPMADDDQVGFLDSTVLELLLTEEQRGMGRQSNGGGGASGANNGGNPNAAGDMATLGSLNFPGLSTGLSGLSFM